MTIARKILVAVDLSPCSAPIVRYARDLSESLEAELEVLHVCDPPAVLHPSASSEGLGADFDEMARVACEEISVQLTIYARGIPQRIEIGTPAEVITAMGEAFDLIVMGTHGRTGLARLTIGSVATKVMRDSRVPVLVVPFAKLFTDCE